MEQNQPKLDLTLLSYPTDRLTIRDLRDYESGGVNQQRYGGLNGFAQEEPAYFEAKDWASRGDLGATMRLERALARKAFAATLGAADPHIEIDPDMSRETIVAWLSEAYREFGLSSGMQHTTQLVRDIEAQASSLARERAGPGR